VVYVVLELCQIWIDARSVLHTTIE
jgi:hypothetical protein